MHQGFFAARTGVSLAQAERARVVGKRVEAAVQVVWVQGLGDAVASRFLF